jgi:hypothetical protein
MRAGVMRALAPFVTLPGNGPLGLEDPAVERRDEAGPRRAGFSNFASPFVQKETGPLGTGRFRASGEEVLL